MSGLRVVVTGGRDFRDDGDRIAVDVRALRRVGLDRLAHGGARGADEFAGLAVARDDGIYLAVYRVDHEVDGPWPMAGPRRNVRMLEAEWPDLVLAYPDPYSRGTWHCIRAALIRDLPVALWAPWLNVAEVLAKVGGGHVTAEQQRFIISRAPVTLPAATLVQSLRQQQSPAGAQIPNTDRTVRVGETRK